MTEFDQYEPTGLDIHHRDDISKKCYSAAEESTCSDVFETVSSKQIEQALKECILNGNRRKIGFTCSSFDMMHPGHVIMLEDCKRQCDYLVVAVQSDPTIDRPKTKNTPIQTFEERKIMVSSCRYVDCVIEYSTENDLYNILEKLLPDVRILGTDWKGKEYTGYGIEGITIYWHDRHVHKFSSSSIRNRVYHAEVSLRERLSSSPSFFDKYNL